MTGDPEESVHDSISSAWDEVSGEQETPDSGIAPPPAQPAYAENDQYRGADGRYAIRPEDEAPQQVAESQYRQAPGGWSQQSQAAFAQLPPYVQEDILRREDEMAQGMEMYQGLRGWVDYAQGQGTTLPQLIEDGAQRLENYAAAEQALATDFYGAVGQLAQYYGVNPQHLVERYIAEQQGQSYQMPGPDPTMQYMRGLEQQIGQLYQFHQDQQNAAINNQLEAFAADHEYYPHVESIMADVINHFRANEGTELSLDEAYDIACRAHPAVFQHRLQRGDYQSDGTAAGQPARSNGQQSATSHQRGRSVSPGSPIPGASTAKRLPRNISAHDEIAAYWDELSGA